MRNLTSVLPSVNYYLELLSDISDILWTSCFVWFPSSLDATKLLANNIASNISANLTICTIFKCYFPRFYPSHVPCTLEKFAEFLMLGTDCCLIYSQVTTSRWRRFHYILSPYCTRAKMTCSDNRGSQLFTSFTTKYIFLIINQTNSIRKRIV